jgi:hypothetical protein
MFRNLTKERLAELLREFEMLERRLGIKLTKPGRTRRKRPLQWRPKPSDPAKPATSIHLDASKLIH